MLLKMSLARHFPALVEDVNFLELSPSDLLQRSGHEDSGDDRAEASHYETGKQSFDRPLHTLAALVARASPRGRVRRNRAARALFKKRALVIGREKGRRRSGNLSACRGLDRKSVV